MTTSPKMSWKLASSLEDQELPPSTLGYFHSLAQDEAHESVNIIFQNMSKDQGITRAFMARRLGKSPEQITRWLAAPGNWTLDTLANLMLSMGYRPKITAERLSEMRQSNSSHPAIARAHSKNLRLAFGPGSSANYTIFSENEMPNYKFELKIANIET